MSEKIEIAQMKELARLFVIFFNAHIEGVEVDRSEIQAGYDLIEHFAGKLAANALKSQHEDTEVRIFDDGQIKHNSHE